MPPTRSSNIVVLGNFNPAIFQPEWFRSQEILPATEIADSLERSSGLVITPDVCQISFKSIQLSVLAGRFQISTERPDWESDLGPVAISVFEKLPHTPVMTLGFNVHVFESVGRTAATTILRHWVPLEALGLLVGDKPKHGGAVSAEWEEYRVLFRIEEDAREAGVLSVLVNFERKVSGGTQEVTRLIARDWKRVLKRVQSLVSDIREPRAIV